MLKKYLKMTIRKLTRNKVYSIINILGLSIGIASSILILLWVTHELSYDRFHKNADEIYRVVGDDGLIGKISTTCGPLSDYLKNNFPGIVNSTRYMPYAGSPFKYNNNLFKVDKGAFADPAFFEMFSYGFIHGDPRSALSNVSSIVITERMAKRFFKNENPMGKTLLIDGRSPLIVSAVIKNPPANSQLEFDFLLNTMILKYIGYPLDDWSSSGIYTFVETQKNTVIQKLNAQIADLMPKHIPGFNRKLFLQPLTGIHLTNDFAYDLPGIGDKKYVFIFSAIALFLILIACINYINLSTARVLKISKEVGLRKIMGANRFQMIQQFFSESMTIVIISFVLAIVLVEIILPAFNQLSGKALTINYFAVAFFYIIAVLLILVSFISGGYPALYLSSVNPVNALKNIFSGSEKGSLFRKVMVVTQFSLSIILIIGTMIVYQQINYIKNKKLGFDKENILYFSAKGNFLQNYNTMKNELLRQSSIVDVTAEDRLFTNNGNLTANLNWEGKDSKTDIDIEYSFVDYNYFDMLNVEMKDGRNFSQNMGTDQNAFILNQEAADKINMKQPVGKKFVLDNFEGKIIGIIKNTNFKSLKYRVEPTAYMVLNNYSTLSFIYNGTILVKTAAGKTHEAIAAIENIWKRENPLLPFEYHFLDETIDNQYIKEIQTGKIFSFFSLLAIFISCLGLYGFSLNITESRIKEIGVRKVLGASVFEILALLIRDFAGLILLANLVAWPIAYYVMNNWLKDFAYKINISPWAFFSSLTLVLTVALLTISMHAIKAATANPVKSLKYE